MVHGPGPKGCSMDRGSMFCPGGGRSPVGSSGRIKFSRTSIVFQNRSFCSGLKLKLEIRLPQNLAKVDLVIYGLFVT